MNMMTKGLMLVNRRVNCLSLSLKLTILKVNHTKNQNIKKKEMINHTDTKKTEIVIKKTHMTEINHMKEINKIIIKSVN